MNHLTKEYVTKLKDSLLFINAVVIIYNASLFLLSTKYISVHYYARDFLNKVSYITRTPQNIFFESIFLFIILVLLMKLREKDNLKMANGLVYIEIILSFLLIIRLNGSYNGILLFVFADLLYNMRNIKHMALLLLMAFGLLLISDYNILSNIIHMPSIESYLSFYPNSSRTFMLFAKNILASLNVVVFILYLICQVLVQQEETKKISKELQLASKVNDELKTYSALSEKMAEDKERKRISREIHDTLGHALTGISAGIDACIALIDIDPQKSKEQLLVISNVVRESIKDVRRSLYKLRPGALDQRTLKDGLIKMIEEFQSVSHLNVDLYYEWENVDFENTKEDIIFRIIQETMTNALRHGHASHIEIHLFDEEEKYMIEAAAQLYCIPEIDYTLQTYIVEGKQVLVATIEENPHKPVYAKDENGKPLAYLRIKDENILATPIHLRVWQQSGSPRGELIRYTEREQLLLDLLEQGTLLSLNRYCRQTGISRRAAEHLLAKFVRYDIVEPVFENHKFYFRMKNE